MFGFCCKRLQLLLPSCSSSVDSVTHLHCFRKASHFSSSYSSKSLLGGKIDKPQEKDGSFTVSYLVNSCGLSPEVALCLSKKRVHFKSREKPDSVIKLLKHYGFNDTDISQLVKKFPEVLGAKPEKTILPKLEFFSSIGLSGNDIARALCSNPSILKRNVDRSLRPCYDIIKSILVSDLEVAVFFKNSYQLLTVKSVSNIAQNVSVLRKLKVPEPSISYYATCQPFVMSLEKEKFHEAVKRVMSLGFHPSNATTFMKALFVISITDSSKWAEKMDFYKKCGWSEDDFLVAFRKNPFFMNMTEKNISSKMDFIVNQMALVQPADLAHYPTVLTYSLEKWIIPRCSVIRVLLLKGLITRGEFNFNTLMGLNKKNFLKRFVVQYQEQVPELLSIFEGKMGLAELGLGFEEN
ncbi:putative transcription regulator mTERF family [Rosa chinensis]|uniref:Putative transcription regulator mTERF family n=1 Tax=Rosa chinensis TaxID=74649 RepID=A0A2P6QY93_ROSCH|nr:transcription termination factor MTERF6, chloroplastic/mitochondrial [Rosa chinensis]PRQ39162.1 putative transcription regulator mTERF family [Rosa chinensis]